MKNLIVVVFLLFLSKTFGQFESDIDSLLNIIETTESDTLKVGLINKVGKLYGSTDIENAIKYNNEAIELSKKVNYPKGIVYGYILKSKSIKSTGDYKKSIKNLEEGVIELKKYEYPQGLIDLNTEIASNFILSRKEFDSAEVYLDNSIEKAKKINYPKGLITAYLNYGTMLRHQVQFTNAMSYYIKADSICSTHTITDNVDCAGVISNIGLIKTILREYDEATKYYANALDYYKNFKIQENGEVATKLLIADLDMLKGNLDDAEVLYKEILDYYTKSNQKPNTAYTLFSLGRVYRSKKMYGKAEEMVNKSIELSTQIKDSLRLCRSLNELGTIRIFAREYKKCIPPYKEALKIAKKLKDIRNIKQASIGLSHAYYNSKDYKNAALLYRNFAKLTDSISKLQSKKATLELEGKYQTEKKEQEITLLKTQNELKDQQKNNQRNLFIAGGSILGLSLLGLLFLYQNKQKTNQKLKELDKFKSNFFANISHEFRTPLTLISSPIEDKLKSETLSKKDRDDFKMIQRNNSRLLELVDQLLDLSKIETGKLNLQIQNGNILDLIGTLADSITFDANQKNIDYIRNINNNNHLVWFDKDVIEKITVNLISNAMKYTPKHGSIIFNAYLKNEILHLEIKNTGNGLTKKQIDKIFERFYQVDENVQGSGVGLSLVKELVTLHKGIIKVESVENEWTTFSVALPVNKTSFKKEAIIIDENIEYNTTSLTTENSLLQDQEEEIMNNDMPILLIVEDNNDVKNLLKGIFKDQYNIITAKNGEKGIELALEHIPDLIISDIMMPLKNGIELTNTLKNSELTSHIPIILLTAKGGEENELIGIETGADDYITKPFNNKILVSKAIKLIEIRNKLRNRYSQEVILKPKDIAITSLDEKFLDKIQYVLNEKLIESTFNTEEFSKAVGMSRMQLHRKLKALTGLSATEFIRDQRLKLAADLLKQSDTNISQVGYAVGFNDHSYFTKCFKEIYKITPSQYAKKA